MESRGTPNGYRVPVGRFSASVSPWRQILPHFDWLTEECGHADIFGGLREFVALACNAADLAGRFVFPSTICMSIFRTPAPVDYQADPMPERFNISPSGPTEIHLRHYLAGAGVPAREWVGSPGDGIAIIAAEFGLPSGDLRSSTSEDCP